MSKKYECEKPPCLHLVIDYPTKKFAVFLEDYSGEVVWIPVSKILNITEDVRKLLTKHFKEAEADEVDELAIKYLEVEPIEEEF